MSRRCSDCAAVHSGGTGPDRADFPAAWSRLERVGDHDVATWAKRFEVFRCADCGARWWARYDRHFGGYSEFVAVNAHATRLLCADTPCDVVVSEVARPRGAPRDWWLTWLREAPVDPSVPLEAILAHLAEKTTTGRESQRLIDAAAALVWERTNARPSPEKPARVSTVEPLRRFAGLKGDERTAQRARDLADSPLLTDEKPPTDDAPGAEEPEAPKPFAEAGPNEGREAPPGSAAVAEEVPRVAWTRLWTCFRRGYVACFGPPLAGIVVALALTPSGYEPLTFVVTSGWLAGGAVRALRPFRGEATFDFRRLIGRAVILAALAGLAGLVVITATALLTLPAPRAGLPVFAALLLVVAAIYWPVWVVRYVLRDTPVDPWAGAWHVKAPDLPLSRALTGAPKAPLRATLPVLLGTLACLAASVGATFLEGALAWCAQIVILLGPAAFLHLLMAERVVALLLAQPQVVALADHVRTHGTLWFVERSDGAK